MRGLECLDATRVRAWPVWTLAGTLALAACGGGGGAAPAQTATLNVSIVGAGFVTSAPVGIDCNNDCTEPYALGTAVTLVAHPGAGSAFAGWSGDADCSDGSVTMSAGRNCTATFTVLVAGSRIMGGLDFSLARGRNGVVSSWGSDATEALGNGAGVQGRSAPGPTSLTATIDAVATAPGASHSLAIERVTGRVWAWGANAAGQLGDGSQSTRADPVVMRDSTSAEVTTAVAVAAGAAHSLVLRADGSVLAAGLNNNGQLGDNTAQSRDFAAPVPNVCGAGIPVTAIAAGADFSVALCADGRVRAWGANSDGQLGDGTFAQSGIPVTVSGLAGHTVTAIAAGDKFALALDSGGLAWSWGSNTRGQLGTDSTVVQRRNVAGTVGGFVGGTAIAAGLEHAVVVLANGAVFAWGANDSGQVSPVPGDPSQVDFSFHVVGLPGIVELAAGRAHSLAVDATGKVWTWGSNNAGQLGIGTTTSVSTPTQIGGLDLN